MIDVLTEVLPDIDYRAQIIEQERAINGDPFFSERHAVVGYVDPSLIVRPLPAKKQPDITVGGAEHGSLVAPEGLQHLTPLYREIVRIERAIRGNDDFLVDFNVFRYPMSVYQVYTSGAPHFDHSIGEKFFKLYQAAYLVADVAPTSSVEQYFEGCGPHGNNLSGRQRHARFGLHVLKNADPQNDVEGTHNAIMRVPALHKGPLNNNPEFDGIERTVVRARVYEKNRNRIHH